MAPSPSRSASTGMSCSRDCKIARPLRPAIPPPAPQPIPEPFRRLILGGRSFRRATKSKNPSSISWPLPGRDLRDLHRLANQRSRIGAGLRREFLGAPAEGLCGVKISRRINGELVHAPECAGERAISSPGVEALAVQVIFEEFVGDAVGHPEVLVGGNHDVIGLADVVPLAEIFAVLVKDLDAAVGAVSDVDAALRININRMRQVELARPLPF